MDDLPVGQHIIGGTVGGLQHERRHAEMSLAGRLLQPPLDGSVDPQLKPVVFHRCHVLTMGVRQLVVNSVMATDIFDKDLGLLRKKRWEDAFNNESNEAARTQVHRKATIVIEHLIQASDVSHTMQHWHVYQKWNERLFEEMYLGYKAGLLENDPSVNWYAGEMGFFDNYIIPLTKKLKECGVFGVSSDEYLNCATNNRASGRRHSLEILDEVKSTNGGLLFLRVFSVSFSAPPQKILFFFRSLFF